MNREEFKEWADDFAERFPSSGEWLRNLSPETRNRWFADVFSQFKLVDAIAVNRDLMANDGVKAFDRENLPSIFLRKIQDWQDTRLADERIRRRDQERKERQVEASRWAEARRARKPSQAKKAAFAKDFDSDMCRAYRDLCKVLSDYREKHGDHMPQTEFKAACEAYWAENDLDAPFDPNENPFNEALQATNE